MKATKYSFGIFCLISVAYLVCTLSGYDDATFYLKPLLLPPLIAAVLTSGFRLKWLLIVGLIFCWAGDILLLFAARDPLFFISGLSAFLIGHVFYILLFTRMIRQTGRATRFSIPVALGLLMYIAAFYLLVGNDLGDMVLPVMVYAFVISVMLYQAIILSRGKQWSPYRLLVAGALSFVISDTILAVHKFHTPLPASGLLIMSTYIFAQGAIVRACVAGATKAYPESGVPVLS